MPIRQSATGTDHNYKGTRGMLGPLTTQGLQALSVVLLWIGALSGGVAVIAGLLSALAANRASDAIQSDADKRIAEAHSTAATANARAAKAGAEIAGANVKIAEAEAEAARLNERAAVLEKATAEATLEQQRLKAQLAWRELSPAQIAQMSAAMAGPPLRVTLVAPSNDAEATAFAEQVGEALRRAGFLVTRATVTMGGRLPTGILLQGGLEEMKRVVRGLNAVGFEPRGTTRDGELEVLVGAKPRPGS